MNFLLKLIVTALAAYALSAVLPDINLERHGLLTAIWFVLILGILNAVVKPVLSFISFPITILTLGLFSLVINVIVVQLADFFTGGNIANGFFWPLIFAFLLSIITSVIDAMFGSDKKSAA
jgi:putative membrane protein